MDKQSFMAGLRAALRWRMPPRELLGILADYEEYFQTGAEEGQTEAQLCQRFGNPREIAATLMAERGNARLRPPYMVVLGVGVLLLGGLMLASYFNFGSILWMFTLGDAFGGGTIFGLFCLVLSGGSLVCCRWDAGLHPSRGLGVLAVGLELLLVALVATLGLLFYNLMGLIDWVLAVGVPIERLGPIMASIIIITQLTIVGVWLWELFAIWRLPEVCIIFFPLNAALLSMMWGTMIVLHSMSDPSYFKQYFLEWVLSALWQLLPLLLLPLLRRKEAPWTAR